MKEIQLNPQQLEAVSHRDGPMIVLSVAGSGKTMVLTERIIHLIEEYNINPNNLLAITFAKKAVLEIISRLKKRLNGNGDKTTVCTFHSLGYRILRAEGYPINGFKLIHNGDQMNLFHKAMDKADIKEEPSLLLSRMSLAKNDLISPPDLEKSNEPEDKKLSKVYSCYELLKRRKRLVDFDDLLYFPYQLFRQDKGILEYYQSRFQHILVDEFQDSSKVMVELVKLLSQTHNNVWLAGDDDQSIHSFRGARSDMFVSLDKEYWTDAKTITMSHNYRSTGNILKAANNLISHNRVRVKKSIATDNEDGEEIQILEAENEIAEAELIAKRIVELISEGYQFNDIAILVRVHRLMPLIEAALIKQKIPYNSYGGFLYNRRDMKTVIAIMRYLISGDTSDGIDTDLIERTRSDIFDHYKKLSLSESFDIAASYLMIKPNSELEDEEERTLKGLYLDAFEYFITPPQNFDDLIESIKEAQMVNSSSFNGKVNLMTIHQAKGLEFKCVFVPGLNEGILPHVNSIEQLVNLEEERRLMFVAITRAMERLFVTYRRRQNGQPITSPSRFIEELSA